VTETYAHLVVEPGPITRVTMNRPERLNALNVAMGVELLAALDAADRDRSVRVVVLTGAGRAFCAGDDLRGMTAEGEIFAAPLPDPIRQYVAGEGRWPLIVARLRAMAKPAIAAVNGHAHGAGFNLAMACDLRVMAASATLAVPFTKRGIATGTSLLQQYVGIGKAMEWALRGTVLEPAEAERWGLVTSVASDEEFPGAVSALAEELAEGPTKVYGITKAAIYRGWDAPNVAAAYEQQGLALHLGRQTQDFDEGRNAFLERRPPRFTGR
jgi:2-(1,2-epoxy-1,2-dihydrophenyl)acetyl-CoA isomerase